MKPESTDKQHNFLIKSALFFAIASSFIILIAKFYAWLHTDSQAILASLVDSLLDLKSSILNILALRLSLFPPDYNHRFGHEKFQDLAIFAQSIFFLLTGIFTLGSSVKMLFYPIHILSNVNYGLNVMYFCTGLTLLLVLYQIFVYQKTKSTFIATDKIHYFSDLLANLTVIISVNLSTNYWYIDPISGIGISIYILYATYKLLRKVVRNLADEEFANPERNKILAVIKKYPEIKGVHDLKTRIAASKPFIQCHLEMDGNLTLYESHRITELITEDLLKIFPGGEVIIHQDPSGIEEDIQYREQIVF